VKKYGGKKRGRRDELFHDLPNREIKREYPPNIQVIDIKMAIGASAM